MAWVTKDSVEQYETPELKKEYTNSYLIVFSPGTPILENILEKNPKK